MALSEPHWSRIGLYPHHGICLPLFSLRTRQSCGIGGFLDLLPLIDWCHELSLDCIQLLPLNDTGSDPSPYNPLSSCALDPIYLSLSAIQEPRLSRSEILALKMAHLRELFDQTFSSLSRTDDYQAFLQENQWLDEYVLFKALKEQFGGIHWKDWPQHPDAPEKKALDFHRFVQYHCFSQMAQVRAHANQRKVFLLGDLPILPSPDSADVWAHPHLFHLDLSAGAPPDAYNPEGQKWGFPLFNWDAHRKEGFAWVKQRLKQMEKMFHLYRIDHVVGYFRIWGIPEGKKPKEGAFYPADSSLWASQGKELLTMMLDATPLLPIAEDLGTIPPLVYPLLRELGICGTKVLRWQRKEEGTYIPYDQYEPFSLTTLSTPDLDPLELWWKKYPVESVPFAHFKRWAYHPVLTQQQRLEILRDAHHTPSYFHINLLQEYLALFPELVWPHPEDERINRPGTLLSTNWTYRFRPFLEEIVQHKGLREIFKVILGK